MDLFRSRPKPDAPLKLDDDNNKALALAMAQKKKHRRCQIRCSSCCRSSNDGPPSSVVEEGGSVFYSTTAGTARYVNSASAAAASSGKIVMEMKTLPSGTMKNLRHNRRASEGGAAAAVQSKTEAGSILSCAKLGSTSATDDQTIGEPEEEERLTIGEPRVRNLNFENW